MMNDRDLLELSAKAAGVVGQGFLDPYGIVIGETFDAPICWNPLKNDGDALRLAAKLGLSIHVLGMRMSASSLRMTTYLGGWMDRTLDDEADYRRVIVRAAAEIGKAMPA